REDERQPAPRLVPHRDRRVGYERGGVGGDGQPEQCGRRPGNPRQPREETGPRVRRRDARHRGRRGEKPGADAHRGGDLEHPQHVEEAPRDAQVRDQERRTDREARERGGPGAAGQLIVPAQLRQEREPRRGAAKPAGEEVDRDLGRPHRLLEDGLAVVGAAVNGAHSPPPNTAAASPAPSTTAAAVAPAQTPPSRRRGSTGSGGSPYTSGSSSSRKNAPAPPTPSSSSPRYSRASDCPASCSWSSRASARSRRSS